MNEVYVPTDIGENAFYLMSTIASVKGSTLEQRLDIVVLGHLLAYQAITEGELIEISKQNTSFRGVTARGIRESLRRLVGEGYVTTQ